jgi:hypothetical protein
MKNLFLALGTWGFHMAGLWGYRREFFRLISGDVRHNPAWEQSILVLSRYRNKTECEIDEIPF